MITRRFIWYADGVKRGWSLVNWETVTSPKMLEDLGFRDTSLANLSLLGKSVWCSGA